MSPETRVERLEARLRVTMHSRGVYTLAHWLSWHETGEPAPPAELAAVMTARRAEAAETMALFDEEPEGRTQ